MIYFDLVTRRGPGRASYAFTAVPVLSPLLSAVFEDLALDGRVLLGTAVVMLGNVPIPRSRRST